MSSKTRGADTIAGQVIHPRPSSIVAALYTLRDLEADVVIIHGPSGCCFKHSRLLEEDGIRVITTAMDETNFVFGGDKILARVITRAVELFDPHLLGVIGSCASMIIGEDIHQAVRDATPPCSVIEVDIQHDRSPLLEPLRQVLRWRHKYCLGNQRESQLLLQGRGGVRLAQPDGYLRQLSCLHTSRLRLKGLDRTAPLLA